MPQIKDDQLIAKKYSVIYEIVSHFSKVEPIGNGLLKKTPLHGHEFSDNEYKKLSFMAKNKNNIFVKFHELTPQYAITDTLDLSFKEAIWKWIKDNIVTDYEKSTVGKYGGESKHDFDAMSDFIMNDVLSPNVNMDVFERLEYISTKNDPIANLLVDYILRLSEVQNWPVTKFDIHIDNIGLDKKDSKLKVFDF